MPTKKYDDPRVIDSYREILEAVVAKSLEFQYSEEYLWELAARKVRLDNQQVDLELSGAIAPSAAKWRI